jgi:hypothetical protein
MDFKKTLLILCLFVGLNTVAQNRLEFNQVLNISSNTTIYSLDTVPQNKVWKIIGSAAQDNTNYCKPIINGVISYTITYPYWLKEGGVIGVWSNGLSKTFEFSIIEFNVVSD